MLFFKRFIATLTAGALSVAAVPVFALGVGLASSADGSATIRHGALVRELRAGAHANARADATIEANTHAVETVWARVRARVMSVLDRSITFLGKTAHRFCVTRNDTDDSRRQCLRDIRADVQTSVSAMIDAAFTF